MFDPRPRFLGQVRLRGMGQAQIGPGQGFGGAPWSVATPVPPAGPPAGYAAQEIAPYGQETELACYACPDSGTYELLRRPDALARGCVYGPPGACPGAPVMAPAGAIWPYGSPLVARGAPPGLMGRLGRLGQGTPASGPGAPSGGAPSQGTPQPASPAGAAEPSDQGFVPGMFPGYGNPYPYGYPGSTRQVCTTRKDDAGNEVKECHDEPSVPAARYPLVTWPSGLFWSW